MAINHNAQDQIRTISEVYEFLSLHDTLGIKEYKTLIKILGTGLATKLRLTPDKNIIPRLEHLYAVTSCASGITPAYANQIILSFEGMSTFYNFDCDLVVEVNGKVILIDFTATKNPSVLEEKHDVLNKKTLHPSLINKNVDILVKGFDPVGFNFITYSMVPDEICSMPEAQSLKFLENICNATPYFRKIILDNCDAVLDHAMNTIIEEEIDIPSYDPPKSNAEKVSLAINSVGSNNVFDTISFLSSDFKKTYNPFLDTLKKLTAQSYDIKEPFKFPIADLTNKNKDLDEILDNLKDDLLANVLLSALKNPGRVSNITKNSKIYFSEKFETSRNNKRMLSITSASFISAKHVKGHYFEIMFSYDSMDNFMKRAYCGENNKNIKPPKTATSSMNAVISTINTQEYKLHETSSILNKRLAYDSHSTIWDKTLSLARLTKNDLGNVGTVATNLISSTAFALSRTIGGALVSHFYEIVKTFAASIKNSHKGETYYVGINGPYCSITITKMSATQDSFDTAHYTVISKSSNSDSGYGICSKPAALTKKVFRSKFRTLNTNDVSYFLRLPYYVSSLLSWDIENSINKGKISTSDIPEKLTASILHCLVNRDLFAQASQQVRYLYMSSIGYGATTADIVKKIDFMNPKSTWEYVYLIRMIKMGLALSIVRDNNSVGKISIDGELSVCFPHSSKPITNLSQVVSSMYYCNIFNKFRAFHEVSEAFCYNELDEEDLIYESCLRKNPLFLAGFSQGTMENYSNLKYLTSTEFIQNEKEYVDILLKSGVGRFRFSIACVIAASRRKLPVSDELMRSVYDSVSVSPIDACTMRGSMDDKKPTDKNQGVRAATAIFEELIKRYDEDPAVLNNNSWLSNMFINNVVESGGDASIFSFVVSQLCDDTIEYFYRIVQKDQVGNREISVLNAVFRIGAMFVENISKSLTAAIKDVDLLENPDKDYVFEKTVQNYTKEKEHDIICYDNSDQKRWGPNHLLNSFCAMFAGCISTEPGLVRLIIHVASKVIRKKAKFPESLISLFDNLANQQNSKITREGLDPNHGSETLKKFYKNHANDITNNIYYKLFKWGMCQGIFHATSSIYHAIMCKIIEDIIHKKYKNKVEVRSFCTSDDSSRIIVINSNLNQVDVIKKIHNIIRRVGILFNIIRNEAKSAFNFFISEFNSIFFKKGIMATPTIKQRISKIDVGAGSNHVEDYMSALSASANYFTIGGSYSGAITLSILNIVLHTEQWNRWDKVSNLDKYYKPVELGGFPIIEPFSTCLAGAVSNLYLRSSQYISDEEYSRVFSTIITENPESITLADYHRVPKSLSHDANAIKIFKSTGALGIFSLVRTDKKLSQFEQRHGLSKWILPESFITLNKFSSDPKHFIYQVYKNGCMSMFSESEGVNSFYKRFTDPWLSKDRVCVKISKKSILVLLGLSADVKYSYNDIESTLDRVKIEESSEILKSFKTSLGYSEFAETLIEQLTPRLNDSKNILNYICSQACAEFIKPTDYPATSRITLRGSGALDHDKYVADLLKILSGEKSRVMIAEIYRDYAIFDNLPTNEDCPNLDLKDSILVAENSVHAFDKYIKRNTKMITSGRPDSLSSLVETILKNRFFEQLGTRLTGRIDLIGDRSHAFSYTSWYKKLQEKSQGYITKFVNNSAVATYADVVKYGLKSSAPIITNKDHFEITDYPDISKRVVIHAPSRPAIANYCKTWVSAVATYNFDYDTVKALYDNKVLNHSEFRVGDNAYTRCASGIYFDMKVNGSDVVHLINTVTHDGKTTFRHILLINTSSRSLSIELNINDSFKEKKWLKSFERFFIDNKELYSSHDYNIGFENDTLRLVTVDLASSFTINLLPYTSTIALVNPEVTIPICFSGVKNIENLNVGYTVTHTDFKDAAILFSNVIGEYEDEENITPQVAKSLHYLMHRTNYSSSITQVNNQLDKFGTTFHFKDSIQLDLFKSLLLSEGYGSKTINSSRLSQHINNLFRSSSERGSYLSPTTLDDKIAYTLDDFIREEEDSENLSDEYYEEHEVEVEEEQEEEEEREQLDFGTFDHDIVDLDDIDFDAFSDDDILSSGEELFAGLDVLEDLDMEDIVSIKSSRTGITINPNQEYPYAIHNYLRRWFKNNTVKRFVGCPREVEDKTHIAKLYLQIYQMSGTASSNLLERLTKERSVTYPCPLSDIVAIKKTVS
jgi:hypothetical protein